VSGVVPGPRVTKRQSYYALFLLALINLLNYLDRNVIFALFEPIKRDLLLTDAQLGWLGSAYVLVFSIAALPFGVLSDVHSRKGVIAVGVSVWSAFTMFSGLTRNFWQLFLCRAMVGVGEAAYGPASASLTADYFPGKNRSIAMGILSAGIPVGGVLGILLGGWLEGIYGWRVAFMAVGLPGFACALLVARIVDPTRDEAPIRVWGALRGLGLGTWSFVRMFGEVLIATALALVVAWVLPAYYAADSALDAAAVAMILGVGLALNIWRWVRLVHEGHRSDTPWSPKMEGAVHELMVASRVVLATPTLVYTFVAGAMIAFGLNGLVGWGPTFMTREFDLTSGQAAATLGSWGLVGGVAGTLAGGFFADWLGRYTPRARVFTVALGLLIGGPLALWLLTVRDLDVFVPMFTVTFFFLSWYNGPVMAVMFDVIPARIGATVSGVYLLFIHLAGDAIAFPLVGWLSDEFGLGRAMLVLPAVSLLGGIVTLGAMRTVVRDMARVRIDQPVVIPSDGAQG
jgi:MFS family permease